MDLGRRQADAFGHDHRLQHIVNQRLHPRVGHILDGGCTLEQDGLAQQGDRTGAHER